MKLLLTLAVALLGFMVMAAPSCGSDGRVSPKEAEEDTRTRHERRMAELREARELEAEIRRRRGEEVPPGVEDRPEVQPDFWREVSVYLELKRVDDDGVLPSYSMRYAALGGSLMRLMKDTWPAQVRLNGETVPTSSAEHPTLFAFRPPPVPVAPDATTATLSLRGRHPVEVEVPLPQRPAVPQIAAWRGHDGRLRVVAWPAGDESREWAIRDATGTLGGWAQPPGPRVFNLGQARVGPTTLTVTAREIVERALEGFRGLQITLEASREVPAAVLSAAPGWLARCCPELLDSAVARGGLLARATTTESSVATAIWSGPQLLIERAGVIPIAWSPAGRGLLLREAEAARLGGFLYFDVDRPDDAPIPVAIDPDLWWFAGFASDGDAIFERALPAATGSDRHRLRESFAVRLGPGSL
jgi:hypothetical protein